MMEVDLEELLLDQEEGKGVACFDQNSRLVSCNSAFLSMYGANHLQVVGMGWRQLLVCCGCRTPVALYDEGRPSLPQELLLSTPGQLKKYTWIKIRAWKDQEGRIVSTHEDISSIKKKIRDRRLSFQMSRNQSFPRTGVKRLDLSRRRASTGTCCHTIEEGADGEQQNQQQQNQQQQQQNEQEEDDESSSNNNAAHHQSLDSSYFLQEKYLKQHQRRCTCSINDHEEEDSEDDDVSSEEEEEEEEEERAISASSSLEEGERLEVYGAIRIAKKRNNHNSRSRRKDSSSCCYCCSSSSSLSSSFQSSPVMSRSLPSMGSKSEEHSLATTPIMVMTSRLCL